MSIQKGYFTFSSIKIIIYNSLLQFRVKIPKDNKVLVYKLLKILLENKLNALQQPIICYKFTILISGNIGGQNKFLSVPYPLP